MTVPIRLLIVEDSPDDAELMALRLSEEGFRLDWQRVENEQDYLASLRSPPDLILADWSLPKFSGLRALQLLRGRGLDIPFIIVSGSIGEEAAVEAMRQGAYDYILKDRPARLGQAIQHALEDKRLREERKRAEEKIVRQNKITEAINHVLRETLRCETDEEVAHICLTVAQGLTGSKFGWIGEVNPSGRLDTIVLSDPGWDSCRMPESQSVKMIRDMEIRGIWSRVLKDGKSLITNAPATHPDRVGFPSGHPELTAFLGVPLKHAGQTIGMIALANKPLGYELHDQEVIETLSVALVEALRRKRAEEVVARGAREWQRTFDATNDAIWILDQDQRVLRTNKTAERFFRRQSSELIGKHCWEIVHGTAQPIPECPILRAGKSLHRETMELQIGERWFEVIVDPIRDAANQYTGAVHIVSDITERKKAEKEMAALQEQLRQSQKIEAIGRLAGGIAHDFNNLLTVIQGNAQLSLLDLREGDPLRKNIDEIKRASERAAELTRQLLAFSRKQVMEMRVLDLNQVLQRLDKMLRRIIGEDIELLVIPVEPIGTVKADPGQMEQVILNIAVNAKDAMPEGGKLTIETANVELDEEYARTHVSVTPGRYVMLSLSDTGAGMTPEVKEKIFEPFFTTKEVGKGTGLGLSTVYGIVKQSGGNIWVYSEPGQGTTFKIYLPRVDEPLEELREEVVKEIARGDETILVVEDEETVRKLAVRVLKRQGYRVLEASEGGKALLLCEEFKDPIHLILTDVVMPGMSGRKLVDRLKEIHPEMKVLYMSGYTDNAILQHGILEPGINFIQKPFAVEVLARKVREVLDK